MPRVAPSVPSSSDLSIQREEMVRHQLERAIGVVYRPETELQSHYFRARLPQQFDEYVWFDETEAVTPLKAGAGEGMPEPFPFGV